MIDNDFLAPSLWWGIGPQFNIHFFIGPPLIPALLTGIPWLNISLLLYYYIIISTVFIKPFFSKLR